MDHQQLSDQIEIQQLCARYMMLTSQFNTQTPLHGSKETHLWPVGNDRFDELQVGKIILNIQNGKFDNYLWQDGSRNLTFNVNNPGIYSLTLSNKCGSKTDTIVALKGACKIYVPNAFTPNGDGLNDVFKASYGENVTKFKLTVYNKWGQKVFESDDINRGWNGNYQKSILPGVFVWMIRYDTSDLKNQLLKGTVMLIK